MGEIRRVEMINGYKITAVFEPQIGPDRHAMEGEGFMSRLILGARPNLTTAPYVVAWIGHGPDGYRSEWRSGRYFESYRNAVTHFQAETSRTIEPPQPHPTGRALSAADILGGRATPEDITRFRADPYSISGSISDVQAAITFLATRT